MNTIPAYNGFVVVIVDDEIEVLNLQREILSDAGIIAETFSDPNAAWTRIQSGDVHLLITDYMMPGMTGMDLLFKTRGLEKPPHVILVTAHGSVDMAVQAMTGGALSLLEKPFSTQHYLALVKRILATGAEGDEPATAPVRPVSERVENTLVRSPAMKMAFEIARSVAQSDSSVLLLGESGTGKEVIADFIHRNSRRVKAPIVKVNCGALPEHLMESELFGHEKGAFTGADKRRVGRFEQAHNGTLFLDEIGDMLQPMQVKLLRALQDHVIERVGSGTAVPVDFRLICATHRNLQAAVDAGIFRNDLYYRINVVPIHLSPLRERVEDIEPLAGHFFNRIRSKLARGPKGIGPQAMERLTKFCWPGNVRQLGNAIEYALVMCQSDFIEPEHLPKEVCDYKKAVALDHKLPAIELAGPPVDMFEMAYSKGLEAAMADFESRLLRTTLMRHQWNVSEAARSLQISRSGMYERITRYGIKRE